MREIFNTLINNVKRFSIRGFLFRKTAKAKLKYIFDLTITLIATLFFILALTTSIAGVITLIVMLLIGYV